MTESNNRYDLGGKTPGTTAESKPNKRSLLDRIFGGDKVLWIIVTTLLIISVFVTYSAMIYKGGNLLMHFVYIAIGIAAMLIVSFLRYQYYGRLAYIIFFGALLLTVIAYFDGAASPEARRNFELLPIAFQPFEILKIGLIMVLAKELAGRQKNIDTTPILPSFWPPHWVKDAQKNMDIITKQTLPLLGPMAIACCVTLLTVGNSTTLIIALTCIIMLFIGRVRMEDLAKITGTALVVAVVYLLTAGSPDNKDRLPANQTAATEVDAGIGRGHTGRSRISTWKADMHVKHAKDKVVMRDGQRDTIEVYNHPGERDQSINAKMSVASGRFFGKGPGMSTHRSTLAKAENDFAYAFIIEEYGAFGGLFILLLFLWMFFRGILIFRKCGTAFPSLLVLGLSLMLILQAMIHMAVSVALFPVTGQQLPLISKGGSSMLFTLTAIGMILGVSRQTANRTLDTAKDESLFEKQ